MKKKLYLCSRMMNEYCERQHTADRGAGVACNEGWEPAKMADGRLSRGIGILFDIVNM